MKRHSWTLKLTITSGLGLLVFACSTTDFRGNASKEKKTIERSFEQTSYPVQSQTFTQGYQGEAQDERFEQGEWGPLDILVVVDNSGSMHSEQQNLSSKLGSLLSYIDASDWQIAVTTTDPDDSCMRKLIKKGDTMADSNFAEAVSVGTGGSGYEQGIYRAVEGLKCRTGLLGLGDVWVRDNSTVAVLIVSDEDNCHVANGSYVCSGQDYRYGSYLKNYLDSIRTTGIDARVYGLITKPNDTACMNGDDNWVGHEYDAVIEATKGIAGSICDSDYSQILTQISKDVAQILKYEFELSHVPDAGTLNITVDNQPWNYFNISDRKVSFTKVPPFGSKVEVSYRHGAAGELLTDFDLEKPAADEGFEVMVDGQAFASDSYRYNQQDNQLEFSNPPAEKSQVTIKYREKVPLLTEFEIGQNVNSGTLKVTIDGQKVASGWSYIPDTGRVVFKDPPPAGSKILITFKEKS